MTTNVTKLVIFIPALNEADTIASVIKAVPDNIPGIDETIVVVIDDGSTDETNNNASNAGAVVVSHDRNLGLADAFRTGIRTCLELEATIAVSIDADLQFDPAEIRNLVTPILEDNADFVVGDRFTGTGRPRHMPLVKYLGNSLMTRAVNFLAHGHFSDVSSGYRAYSREALLNINVQSSFTYTQESFIELAAKGLRIKQIPVTVKYYEERSSRISANVLKYGIRTFLTIARTTRDYAPFSIFGTLAFVFIIPGFACALFILFHYILQGTFSPYIFIAFIAAYLITLGFGLLVLALVADMLRGIRSNQERLLYYAKIHEYGVETDSSG